MKHSYLCPLVLFSLVAFVSPASAAMEVLNDEDLESITAAGQPTVLISKNGTAEQKDVSTQVLNLVENSQHGLRSLAIANVVGEAQLLVNLNVISVSGDIAGVDQRNFSVQSWGSTLPEIAATVEGESAVDVEIEQEPNPECLGACTTGDTVVKGDTNVGVTNIAAPGDIEIASATGDVIVDGDQGATVFDASAALLNFEPNAQVDLAALFITNIVGRTQAAFNMNIASSTLNLFPSTDAPFTEPSASSSAVLKQVNSGVQFRGTPINAAASIFVDHTP